MQLCDFVGNGRLVSSLRRGHLPASVIFAGPDGVGKRTLAVLLASLANCIDRPAPYELCGACSSCLKAASGNHPDIRVFGPEKQTIKIDSIRELAREAAYRPFEGRHRFMIVDHAEKMSLEAANSLLKTLEEPPETTSVLLITAYPQALLPTILSRCQTFNFSCLSKGEVLEFLESLGDKDSVEMRAAFAGGSIGRALSLDVRGTTGLRNVAWELLAAWLREPSFGTIFQRSEKSPLKGLLKKREETVAFLQILQSLTNDLYFIQVGTPDRIVNSDRLVEMATSAELLNLESLDRLLYHVAEAIHDLERNANPLICFETLWLKSLVDGVQ